MHNYAKNTILKKTAVLKGVMNPLIKCPEEVLRIESKLVKL